jgi:AbrB family looped-hinge helix DNA binding protein
MNIGTITKPNQKGQIVIPKAMRDKLHITEHVPLNIIARGRGIYIYILLQML